MHMCTYNIHTFQTRSNENWIFYTQPLQQPLFKPCLFCKDHCFFLLVRSSVDFNSRIAAVGGFTRLGGDPAVRRQPLLHQRHAQEPSPEPLSAGTPFLFFSFFPNPERTHVGAHRTVCSRSSRFASTATSRRRARPRCSSAATSRGR